MSASRPSKQRPVLASKRLRDVPPLSSAQLHKVQNFISSNLSEKMTWGQIAYDMHLSGDYLARQFRVSTGQSLRQYIIEQRLQQANQLLLTSELAIAEIAVCLGFTDQSHLTRRFKRRFGVTPQAIRKSTRDASEVDAGIYKTAG
ncbi:MAG: AraC family transcriptional regulator [Anaerolineae bacterium]